MTPGHLLKSLRKDLGLSQTEFAKQLGVSQGGLSKFESGRTRVTLEAFLRAYQMTLEPECSGRLYGEFERFLLKK